MDNNGFLNPKTAHLGFVGKLSDSYAASQLKAAHLQHYGRLLTVDELYERLANTTATQTSCSATSLPQQANQSSDRCPSLCQNSTQQQPWPLPQDTR